MRRSPAASLSTPADERSLPAEIVFLILVLCLSLFFTLAGVPGLPEPRAGNGSRALRQGWSERDAGVADPTGTPASGRLDARGR